MLDILENKYTDRKGLFVHNNFLDVGERYLREKLDLSVVEDVTNFETIVEGIKGKEIFDYVLVLYTREFDNSETEQLNCIVKGLTNLVEDKVFVVTDTQSLTDMGIAEGEDNTYIKLFEDTLIFKDVIDLIRGELKGEEELDDEGFFTKNDIGSKVESAELNKDFIETVEEEIEEEIEEDKEEEIEEDKDYIEGLKEELEEEEDDSFDIFDLDVTVAD